MHWFEFDKKRFVLEYIKVKTQYPEFELLFENGKVFWQGEVSVKVKDLIDDKLKIRIKYDDSYPITPPDIFPIEPTIASEHLGHDWHRYNDGTICYVHHRNWSCIYFTTDVIDKVKTWYINYLLFLKKFIDKMPDTGLALIAQDEGNQL